MADVYEVRKCATLGIYWRDIYKNGELFAMQVETKMAHRFVENPQFYAYALQDVVVLRRLAMESEDERVQEYLINKKERG